MEVNGKQKNDGEIAKSLNPIITPKRNLNFCSYSSASEIARVIIGFISDQDLMQNC